ncbi:hypothetical protein [Corynebacterium sp. c7Ub_26]
MTFTMIAYIGAVCAAIAYGGATILQAIAVGRLAALPAGSSWGRRIRAGWLYGLGLVCDFLGFLMSALALHSLPLFLVESTVASSVAVTAVLAVVVLHQRLTAHEVIAVAVLVAGLIVLGVTAEEGPARAVAWWVGWGLCALAIPLAAVAAVCVVASQPRWTMTTGIVLSVISGLGFGFVGVAARLVTVHSSILGWLSDAFVWAMVLMGGLAVVAYGYALDRLPTTTVAALSFACETIVPSAIGLIWLGDEVRPGLMWLAGVGFVAVLGACVQLSSKAEVEA